MKIELELASERADAELGVAEQLGWPMGLLAAGGAHLAWENWLVTVLAAFVTYYAATFKYRRRAAAAEDRYFKAAGLGKYVKTSDSETLCLSEDRKEH